MTARLNSIVVAVALIAQLLMPIGVVAAAERGERREHRGAKVVRVEKPQRGAKAKSRQRRQLAPAAVGARAATLGRQDETASEPFNAATNAPTPGNARDVDASAPRTDNAARSPLRKPLRKAQGIVGTTVATEERPFYEFGGFAFGLDFGLTLSEYRVVRDPARKGVEWIHVVNLDGRSNLETVLARWPLKKGKSRRLELQGPALNSDDGSELPLGVRVLGLGLTDDFIDRNAGEAVSYTVEVKATQRTLAELAALGVPLAARLLPGAGVAATRLAELLLAAVPVVNVLFAANTAWRAWRVAANPNAGNDQRLMAVAHLGADVLRVFMPAVGTVVSVALVVAFGLRSYGKLRQLRPA